MPRQPQLGSRWRVTLHNLADFQVGRQVSHWSGVGPPRSDLLAPSCLPSVGLLGLMARLWQHSAVLAGYVLLHSAIIDLEASTDLTLTAAPPTYD